MKYKISFEYKPTQLDKSEKILLQANSIYIDNEKIYFDNDFGIIKYFFLSTISKLKIMEGGNENE